VPQSIPYCTRALLMCSSHTNHQTNPYKHNPTETAAITSPWPPLHDILSLLHYLSGTVSVRLHMRSLS
jgi:hypothetical protein